MPLLQGQGGRRVPRAGAGAVSSTRADRSWHRSPDLTRELEGKREGASCGLGKNLCWEPPRRPGLTSGQSPLEPQKQPTLGGLEDRRPQRPQGEGGEQRAAGEQGSRWVSLPKGHPLWPNAGGVPSVCTAPPGVASACHLQGHQSQAEPRGSAVTKLACKPKKKGCNEGPLSLLCPQGKSFIKEALKCKAHALRHRFGCISRKCPAIKDMVSQLQRECYLRYNLCSAAQENTQVMVEMIHFKDLLQQE